jgi:hypothetical protein
VDALTQAKQLVDEIYKLTKELVLTGDERLEEQEVEAYVALMEAREPLVGQLTELRQKVDATTVSSVEFSAIKQTIADIANLEKEHLATIGYMRDGAQESFKGLKHGQKIRAGYNTQPVESMSRMFDMKQ